MEEATTSIRVGDGPEIPINLDDPDAPENAAAKEAIAGAVQSTVACDQLRLFIERIERLAEEKQAISDDIKEVYAEAKANGYDAKIVRLMVRLRKMETHTRQEQAALAATYAEAIGLQGVLPL